MLVSAIMPTRGRRQYALEAIECFRSQTFAEHERELVIVDDQDDPSFPDGVNIPNLVYVRLKERKSIGYKRNYACALASGKVVMHWDDDDYSAPGRMTDQFVRLVTTGVVLTGYHSMRFQCRETGDCWRYVGSNFIAIGTSLTFRRDWWKSNPFPDLQLGEDMALVDMARNQHSMLSVDGKDFMVSWVHDQHTSERLHIGENTDAWRSCEPLEAHRCLTA